MGDFCLSAHEGFSRVLVFTACYNEAANISLLVEQVFTAAPQVDMLVVDDSSPDGTSETVKQLQKMYPRLILVTRPRKRGIGSAHKYSLLYAMRENYDYVLTMDADFSHNPSSIPSLLAAAGPNIFVTGSRYCEGGKSDYSGYRDVVSRLGNFAARNLLNLKINELTTYFRVFDVDALRRIPLRLVHSEGYSYGVQIVYYLRKQGVVLKEVPIHFVDRLHGTSKIPRWQIVTSAIDLLSMWVRRLLHLGKELSADVSVNDACSSCGDQVLTMKFEGARDLSDISQSKNLNVAAYKCTSLGARSHPPVYTCLNCGLDQVPSTLIPPQLEELYEAVEDETYLANIEARKKTFARCFDRMQKWLPLTPGSMLEVGSYCGLFLQEAKRRNWNADGVEPSRWAANYARTVSNVSVQTGFLKDNTSNLKSIYDVVVAWDVLEHVRDPVSFARECGDKLAPGGFFFFSTLDTGNWFAKLLGKKWPWLIDMHIQYFDKRSVVDVLRRAGFELVATEPYTHYAKMNYALKGVARILPKFFSWPIQGLAKTVPDVLMLPIALGDIRMYVAKKMNVTLEKNMKTHLANHG
jgi:SAM-dependent methyltransferase